MEWYNVLLLLVVALLSAIYLFFKKKFSYWKDRGVVYIEPSIPMGNIKTPQEHFKDFLDRMYRQKVGPFTGAYLFATPVVIASDLDFIKDVLIKDFNSFHERGLYVNEKDDPLSAHMFSVDGNKWRLLRAKLSPTFTSGKMKFMYPTVVNVTEKFNEVLSELVKKDKTLEMHELLACFTTDMIGTCAFGIECNSLKDPDSEFRTYGRKVFAEQRHKPPVQIFMLQFPNLSRKLGLKLNRDDVSDFFLQSVRETIEFREKNNVRRNDFMDLLIQLKNNEALEGELAKELGKLSFEDVAAQAFVFFLGGFETSSTTMNFSLYELALNQDIQEKAREEINRVLAKHNGELTYDAVMEMNYIDQIVSETLRKFPPLINLMRRAVNDYEVANSKIVIEKGMMIIIPVYSIHHDPEVYPDPEVFDPDRFGPEEIKARHSMSFLGFGDGPRNCVGLRFGRLQSRIGLIMLLKNYRFKPSPKTPIPMVFSITNPILAPVGGMYLEVEKIVS